MAYLQALLHAHGRTIDVVNLAENENDKEDVPADLVTSVSACTAPLSGQRRAKRTTELMAVELQRAGEEAQTDATR